MKKFLFAVCLVAALSLSACSKPDTKEAPKTEVENIDPESPVAGPKLSENGDTITVENRESAIPKQRNSVLSGD